MIYKEYKKLVRDGIPDKIRANGEVPHVRILEAEEFRELLKAKLVEEAQELMEARDTDQMIEEMADCLEVIKAVAIEYDISWEDITAHQIEKREKRGGFDGRVFLEGVDEKE